MVTQYPHTVTISSVSESTQDENGNYVPGTPSTFEFNGRFETNKAGNFLTAANGEQVVFSGIIYARYSTPNVPLGTGIEVMDGSSPVAKGKAVQFSRGQLNVRIWMS
jgi:hypothetical protein